MSKNKAVGIANNTSYYCRHSAATKPKPKPKPNKPATETEQMYWHGKIERELFILACLSFEFDRARKLGKIKLKIKVIFASAS